MADTYKFRIDHHGSLIRPPELLAARDTLDGAALRAVEDAAIADAVRAQRRLNLSVVTDGDFRRADFRGAVLETVSGFRRTGGSDGDGLAGWVAAEGLKAGGPLVAEDAAAFAAQTRIAAKATLPAPSYLAARCFDPAAGSPWTSARHLGDVLAEIIRAELELLVAHGIRYVQLNNPGYLLSGGLSGLSLQDAIAVDAAAVRLAVKPDDVRIGLCPAHHASGELDVEAARRLFAEVPVDRWVLPYHTGAEAEVALLRAVPADRDACLGIVDAGVAELEDIDAVLDRMDVAASVKDVEDLAVSPNAGFSDVAGRAAFGAEDQRRKLIHVETVARMCWGNEL